VVPQEAAGSTATAAESNPALANKYASLLRQSWGKKELDEVVSQIKRDEQKLDARALSDLRALYRKQLSAYEQSVPKDEYVPDADFLEGNE
jgi:hypothetical protein